MLGVGFGGGERDDRVDAVSAARAVAGVQGAAHGADPFPHTDQTVTGTPCRHGRSRCLAALPRPVVAEPQGEPVPLRLPGDGQRGVRVTGVLEGVGEGFLYDAVDGEL